MNFDERTRIQKAGGYVKYVNLKCCLRAHLTSRDRFRDGRLLGILEVSRAIGDFQLKVCYSLCGIFLFILFCAFIRRMASFQRLQ